MNRNGPLLTLTFCLLCSGCGPLVKQNVSITSIPVSSPVKSVPEGQSAYKIKILKFTDSRPTPNLGEYDGTTLLPQGDLGLTVQQAFERYSKEAGFRPGLFDAPSVTGEIIGWNIDVTKDFPLSTAEARAALKVNLISRDGKKLFEGKYTGTTSLQLPIFVTSKLEDLLGEAMGYAVGEAIADRELLSKLQEASNIKK